MVGLRDVHKAHNVGIIVGRTPAHDKQMHHTPYHSKMLALASVQGIVTIEATQNDHQTICEVLEYDMRRRGPGGRRLTKNLTNLGPDKRQILPKGARLVLHGDIKDCDSIDNITTFPVTLRFFVKDDPFINFACPLFSIIGFTMSHFALDLMHTCDLGPTQWLIALALWTILLCNSFKLSHSSKDELLTVGMHELRADMDIWYASQRSQGKELSEIGKLTLEMLGPRPPDAPVLKAKAAESRHLVAFVVHELQLPHVKAATQRNGNFLLESALRLQEFYTCLESTRGNTSPALAEKLYGMFVKSFTMFRRAGGRAFPKHHYMYHLLQRMAASGHPMSYWCYADEGDNRERAAVARSVHSLTFYASVMGRDAMSE